MLIRQPLTRPAKGTNPLASLALVSTSLIRQGHRPVGMTNGAVEGRSKGQRGQGARREPISQVGGQQRMLYTRKTRNGLSDSTA